jgi:hypothetical protein
MRGVVKGIVAIAVVLAGLTNLSSVPITAEGGNSHDGAPTSLVGAWSSEVDSTHLRIQDEVTEADRPAHFNPSATNRSRRRGVSRPVRCRPSSARRSTVCRLCR